MSIPPFPSAFLKYIFVFLGRNFNLRSDEIGPFFNTDRSSRYPVAPFDPPLLLGALACCQEAAAWLAKDEKHVVTFSGGALAAKSFQGGPSGDRSGCMACLLLLWLKECDTAVAALNLLSSFLGNQNDKSSLTSSQARFVHYFEASLEPFQAAPQGGGSNDDDDDDFYGDYGGAWCSSSNSLSSHGPGIAFNTVPALRPLAQHSPRFLRAQQRGRQRAAQVLRLKDLPASKNGSPVPVSAMVASSCPVMLTALTLSELPRIAPFNPVVEVSWAFDLRQPIVYHSDDFMRLGGPVMDFARDHKGALTIPLPDLPVDKEVPRTPSSLIICDFPAIIHALICDACVDLLLLHHMIY